MDQEIYIVNCKSDATVQGEGSAGGLGGSVEYAYESYFSGTVTGITDVGGIIGYGTRVRGCYNTGEVSGNDNVGGLVGRISKMYNVEKNDVRGIISNSLMLGKKINKTEAKPNADVGRGKLGQICGWVGASVGAENIYARADLASPDGNPLNMNYYYDGKNISIKQLKEDGAFEDLLGSEDAPLEENWKVSSSGTYPQLLWENDDPILVS